MSTAISCNRCGGLLPSSYIGHRAGRVDMAGPQTTERWKELYNQRLCADCWDEIEVPAFGVTSAPTPTSLRAYASGRLKEAGR